MACRTGCPTQDHASWGACARASNMRIAYAASSKGMDKTKQDRWDSELAAYRQSRREGINPEGTTRGKIEAARMISDAIGKPWNAERPYEHAVDHPTFVGK